MGCKTAFQQSCGGIIFANQMQNYLYQKNEALVTQLKTIELKAFIPAKDFALSKHFYQDIGFTRASDEDGIAYFHYGNVSFLLQDFYVKERAENLMMHLLVEDVDAWCFDFLIEQRFIF
jgi:hypothetical protein